MSRQRGVRKITVDRDPSYAPCAYLICKVTGPRGKYDWDTRDEATTVLVQTDWDYTGVASTFGWVPCRKCRATDGTVDCEHRTASEMIADARAYLDRIAGRKFVEDPGYFRGTSGESQP